MTDLTGILRSAEGDGVHWALQEPGDLNVNLVHLDAGHVVGEHANDEVDVVVVVLAGRGRLAIDGVDTDLTPHVVVRVPRTSRRRIRAADDEGLDYLSIHRRRGPLDIRPQRSEPAVTDPRDEGGDPACWAHLFEDGTEAPR